jgi:formylglycine-generating enzyme required for sulfatase activity
MAGRARTARMVLALASAVCLTDCQPCLDKNAIIDGIEFVYCPPDSFLMGRNPGEAGSSSWEDPQHVVTFAKGFWISKYEITQSQWWAVMETRPSAHHRLFLKPTADYPVDSVTWDETQDFFISLNELRPGNQYRLPSEAEWEYACRAGTTTRYFWGDDPDTSQMPDYAWVPANSAGSTHPVGQLQPNAWGIYDMCGNVWEWVQDYAHGSYTGAPTDGSAWETPATDKRSVRGGSWYNNQGCRSAFRGGIEPEGRYGDYGFRIVYSQP